MEYPGADGRRAYYVPRGAFSEECHHSHPAESSDVAAGIRPSPGGGFRGASAGGFEERHAASGHLPTQASRRARPFDTCTPTLVASPAHGLPGGVAGVFRVDRSHHAAAVSAGRKRRLNLTMEGAPSAASSSSFHGGLEGRRLDLHAAAADGTAPARDRDRARREAARAYAMQSVVTTSAHRSPRQPPRIETTRGGHPPSSLARPCPLPRDPTSASPHPQAANAKPAAPVAFIGANARGATLSLRSSPGDIPPGAAFVATQRQFQRREQIPLKRHFENTSRTAVVAAPRSKPKPKPKPRPQHTSSPLLYVGVSIQRSPQTPRLGLNIAIFDSSYLVLGDVDEAAAGAVTTWSWITDRTPPPYLLQNSGPTHDAAAFRRGFASLPRGGGNAPFLHGGLAVHPGLKRLQAGDAVVSLNGRPVSSFAGGLDNVTAYLKVAQSISVVAVRHVDALRAAAAVRAEFLSKRRAGDPAPRPRTGDLVQHSADRSFRALRAAMDRSGGGFHGRGHIGFRGGHTAAETVRRDASGGTAARRTLFAGDAAGTAPAARKAPLIVSTWQTKAPVPVFQGGSAGTTPAAPEVVSAHQRRQVVSKRTLPSQPLTAAPRSVIKPTTNGMRPSTGPSPATMWLLANGIGSGASRRAFPMPDLDEDYDPDKYPWLFVPRVPLNTQIETNFSGWLSRRKTRWREKWNIESVASTNRRSSVESVSDDDFGEERVALEFWRTARGFPSFQHWLAAQKAHWRVGYSWNRRKRRKLERDCEREVHFPITDDDVDPAEISDRLQEWLSIRKKQWQILRRKRQRQLAEEAAAATLEEAGDPDLIKAESSTPVESENESVLSVDAAAESYGNGNLPNITASALPTLAKNRSTSSEVDLIDAILEDQEQREKKFEDRQPFDISFLFDASLGAPDDVIVHCVSYLHRSEHGKLLCINWGTAYCLKQRNDMWRALCPKHWTLPRRPRKPWHSLYLTKIREEEEQVRKQSDEVLVKAAGIMFKADHLQKIERLVNNAQRKFGFSVNYTSGVVLERNSLLNLAIIEKRHKIAKWLVENRGASIETCDRGQFTPLLNAAWEGDKYMVRYLLGKGADRAKIGTGHSSQALAHPDFKGLSAEGWARKRGHEEVAELIRLGLA